MSIKPPADFGTDAISKALSKPTLLDDLDALRSDREKLSDENRFIRSEAFRWRAERDAAVNQLLDMRAQRDSLAERLRGSPEVREIVSELRQMLRDLDNDLPGHSRRRLERLLRRLDESPNTTTTP